MKVLKNSFLSPFMAIIACLGGFSLNAVDVTRMMPSFQFPIDLYPPKTIQEQLRTIFTPEFISQTEDVWGVPNLKPVLDAAGFKILQYFQDDFQSLIVVEHPAIPNYVFKFSRSSDIVITYPMIEKGSATEPRGSIKRLSDLKLRVENAKKLQGIIRDNAIDTIIIPQKYLMYINKFPIVVAEKVNIPEQAPLNLMNLQQFLNLLFVVGDSNGILDLAPRNLPFDGNYIYLIDTERVEQPTLKALRAVLKTSLPKITTVINPIFAPCVDEWFANLGNINTVKDVCPTTTAAIIGAELAVAEQLLESELETSSNGSGGDGSD